MKYKYLGFISDIEFSKLNKGEQKRFLFDNKIIRSEIEIFNSNIKLNQKGEFIFNRMLDTQKYSHSYDVCFEFYHFILELNKGLIGADVLDFQNNFEFETYGMSDYDKKTKGLNYFNKYFFKCCEDPNSKESRFKALSSKRDHLINLTRYNNELIGQFLIGNSEYLETANFVKTKFLDGIIEFENNLQILLYLNNRFKFEEDQYFSEKSVRTKIFEEYKNKFESIKVVDFIESIFSNSIYRKRKYGLAMWDCLKNDLKLMQVSANVFKQICNTYFDCDFKNLERGQISDAHQNHINNFKNKWEEFNV